MMTVVHCPHCLESWAWDINDFTTMQEYFDFNKYFDVVLYEHIDEHRGSM